MTDEMTFNAYDQVPYPGLSYSHTYPDRLATVAILLGMKPTPIERCRVLELGCASGGNLIPLAYTLPESQFVGIDYSSAQIEAGKENIQALGLKNIVLEHLNILDVDQSRGEFDYIIAHGVFSWVPTQVRDKVLSICKENLTANGVAYVSYNTYPGWRQLGVIREMMLYHTREMNDPQERATRARALLNFLAEAVSPDSGAYGSLLNMYARLLQGEFKGAGERGDALLLHDELEEINQPLYFHQFMVLAKQQGLQYLGDAEFHTMVSSNFPLQVSETLEQMSNDVIELEQYMDFLRDRTFRRTLLCHDHVKISRALRPEQVLPFYIASRTKPEPDAEAVHTVQVARFHAGSGATLSTDHPVTKEAMLYLAEIWPRSVTFDHLLATARVRLELNGDRADPSWSTDAYVLSANILQAYSYSDTLVELHTYQPEMFLQVSERPIVSPVARLQAREISKVTNLCHERVDLDDLDRHLLHYLDGRHDCASMVESLIAGPLADGRLTITPGADDQDEPGGSAGSAPNAQEIRDIVTDGVRKRLHWLAQASLLVG
ncbi:MAG: methyltransferase regulatory domain-containing protein [Anaerolineae bacterium]|nr:methyltransferase regulatory domain-containing protein [Anaerolineae bacterium]